MYEILITGQELHQLKITAALRSMVGAVISDKKGTPAPTAAEIQRALKKSLANSFPAAFDSLKDIVTMLPEVMGVRLNGPISLTDITRVQQDLATAIITRDPQNAPWIEAARYLLDVMDDLKADAEEIDASITEALKIENSQQRLEALKEFLVPAFAEVLVNGRPTHGEMLRLRPSVYFTEYVLDPVN